MATKCRQSLRPAPSSKSNSVVKCEQTSLKGDTYFQRRQVINPYYYCELQAGYTTHSGRYTLCQIETGESIDDEDVSEEAMREIFRTQFILSVRSIPT